MAARRYLAGRGGRVSSRFTDSTAPHANPSLPLLPLWPLPALWAASPGFFQTAPWLLNSSCPSRLFVPCAQAGHGQPPGRGREREGARRPEKGAAAVGAMRMRNTVGRRFVRKIDAIAHLLGGAFLREAAQLVFFRAL